MLMKFKNSVLIYTGWKFECTLLAFYSKSSGFIIRKAVGVPGLPLTSCVPIGLNFRFPCVKVSPAPQVVFRSKLDNAHPMPRSLAPGKHLGSEVMRVAHSSSPLRSESWWRHRAHPSTHMSKCSPDSDDPITSPRLGFHSSVCGFARHLWFSSSAPFAFFFFPTRSRLPQETALGQWYCRTTVRGPGSCLASAMNLLCDFKEVMISLLLCEGGRCTRWELRTLHW